jgi:hypothetical protein
MLTIAKHWEEAEAVTGCASSVARIGKVAVAVDMMPW